MSRPTPGAPLHPILVPVLLSDRQSNIGIWKVEFDTIVRKGDVLATLKPKLDSRSFTSTTTTTISCRADERECGTKKILTSPAHGILRRPQGYHSASVVACIEPCQHPTSFGGICAVCGMVCARDWRRFNNWLKYETSDSFRETYEREKQKFQSEYDGSGGLHSRSKMDPVTGQYLPWEGCTIVMKMADDVAAKALYDRLASDDVVTSFISLLPWQSYHVTLRPLMNRVDFQTKTQHKSRIDGNFAAMVELDNHFQSSFHNMNSGSPGHDSSSSTTSTSVYLSFRVLHSSENGGSLDLVCDQEPYLRSLEDLVAGTFRFVPPTRQSWHLTLGYRKKCSRETFNLAIRAISAHVRQWDEDYLAANQGRIRCLAPRVCWFKDMTQFHPIEGLFPSLQTAKLQTGQRRLIIIANA